MSKEHKKLKRSSFYIERDAIPTEGEVISLINSARTVSTEADRTIYTIIEENEEDNNNLEINSTPILGINDSTPQNQETEEALYTFEELDALRLADASIADGSA